MELFLAKYRPFDRSCKTNTGQSKQITQKKSGAFKAAGFINIPMRKRILNQPIDVISKEEALYRIRGALTGQRQFKIVTLNPEMIINAQNNFEFQSAINEANLIVPDGTGIKWPLRLQGEEEVRRIPGIELAESMLEIANELSKKVAFFGGKKEVLEKAMDKLKEKYPSVQFVIAKDGYRGEDKEIANEIKSFSPDIVFVALGSPRQEVWINKYSNLFPKSTMIGIGGSIDIWSGKKKRAPAWMRKNNIEWLYRVITEPGRTIRILKALPVYIWMVLKSLP